MREHQDFPASWVERYILRRRLLFFTKARSSTGESTVAPAGFRIEKFSAREVVQNPGWAEWLPHAFARAQGDNFSLDTYLIFKEGVALPVGAGSVLLVHYGKVWYDNIPAYPHEARLIGLAVLPEYRGKGLGRFLQRERFNAANNNDEVNLISAVVERHRVPSIRAQQAVFPQVTSNWLVKFAGQNVVSVVTGGEHRGLWYVGPGYNCRWRNEI